MKTINTLLNKLQACEDACKWAKDKTWDEIFKTCHRGDWLLWLHFRTNHDDIQVRTLAKGHCANTVRHLMKDERSIAAVDAAISFGNGEISRKELDAAAADADAAAADADADAAYAAADAAVYAAAAAADAADSAVYAAAAAAAAAADAAARKKNQQETADIVRKYIPIESWNITYDEKE